MLFLFGNHIKSNHVNESVTLTELLCTSITYKFHLELMYLKLQSLQET